MVWGKDVREMDGKCECWGVRQNSKKKTQGWKLLLSIDYIICALYHVKHLCVLYHFILNTTAIPIFVFSQMKN